MMGLVFKTSRAAARVVAGGFDSHVPPPILSDWAQPRSSRHALGRVKDDERIRFTVECEERCTEKSC